MFSPYLHHIPTNHSEQHTIISTEVDKSDTLRMTEQDHFEFDNGLTPALDIRPTAVDFVDLALLPGSMRVGAKTWGTPQSRAAVVRNHTRGIRHAPRTVHLFRNVGICCGKHEYAAWFLPWEGDGDLAFCQAGAPGPPMYLARISHLFNRQ